MLSDKVSICFEVRLYLKACSQNLISDNLECELYTWEMNKV